MAEMPKTAIIAEARAAVETRIAVEREIVAMRKQHILAMHGESEWNNQRAAITKRLYNLKEQRHVLNLLSVFPERKFYAQVKIVGIVDKKGKFIHKFSKGEIRIADWAERWGKIIQLGDIKSGSAIKNSVEGGLIKDPDIEAVFRDSSEIRKQLAKELAAIKKAKKMGGRLVLEGQDLISGKKVPIIVDWKNVRGSIVVEYLFVHDPIEPPVAKVPPGSVAKGKPRRVGAAPTRYVERARRLTGRELGERAVPDPPRVPPRKKAAGKGKPKPVGRAVSSSLPELRTQPVPRPKLKAGPIKPKIDMSRLRLSAGKALRVGKGLGKALWIDLVAMGALAWYYTGHDEKKLKELAQKKESEIQKRMQQALEEHIKNLRGRPGTTYFVIKYFLIYMASRLDGRDLLHDMLIRKVYIMEEPPSAGCYQGNYKDLDDYRYTSLVTKVMKCTTVSEFDYPDVGKPSISGIWTEYVSADGEEHPWAKFRVIAPPNGEVGDVALGGEGPSKDMHFSKAEWTGRTLKITAHRDKSIFKYWLYFTQWNVLKGTVDISTKYHIQEDGTRTWENRTTVWRR